MTTQEIINYYAGLLIIQYLGKPKAYATIQTLVTPVIMPQITVETISFSGIAASGAFVLSYDGVNTASINWNDSASTIQSKIQAISGLGSVTVSGSIASQLLTVTFTGVTPPALLLVEVSSSLQTSAPAAISLSIDEIDQTLPIAVQNAFNVIGDSPAQGVQLDVIGKYAGVTRNGYVNNSPITLDDADFLTLIQLAIVKNGAGSSLYDIQNLLHTFFPNEILVFDYQNMQMSYLVSTAIGSLNLILMVINMNLLPKPMAVSAATIIYAANITNFFGFRTYENPAFNVKPFNDYSSYQMDWPWLSYGDAILT